MIEQLFKILVKDALEDIMAQEKRIMGCIDYGATADKFQVNHHRNCYRRTDAEEKLTWRCVDECPLLNAEMEYPNSGRCDYEPALDSFVMRPAADSRPTRPPRR